MPVTITEFSRSRNEFDPTFSNNFGVSLNHSFLNGEVFEETRAYLKIAVPNNNYRCHSGKVYDITATHEEEEITSVLVVITDDTTISRKPDENTHILEVSFLVAETGISSIENGKLQVIVLNEHPEDFDSARVDEARAMVANYGLAAYSELCDNKKIKGGIKIVEPDEECGGVIAYA